MHHCPWLFHVSFQGETQVLMLIQQALDWSSHLLSPSLKKERKTNQANWKLKFYKLEYVHPDKVYGNDFHLCHLGFSIHSLLLWSKVVIFVFSCFLESPSCTAGCQCCTVRKPVPSWSSFQWRHCTTWAESCAPDNYWKPILPCHFGSSSSGKEEALLKEESTVIS